MWHSLARVRSDWDRHAEIDPLWAILTDPRMKDRRWETEAFFETGRREIDALMHHAASLEVPLVRHRAMDFGCGVGRLTRALAVHFDEVYGVDISPAMLRLAREYNSHIPNCIFVQNPDPSFRAVPVSDFDLIYSTITLQHMPPRHAMRYLRGLVGRLRPGGLLVFQLVDRCRRPLVGRPCNTLYQEIVRRYLLRAQPAMDVYGLEKQRVIALVEQSGCRMLRVEPNDAAGPHWTSYRYAALREGPASPHPAGPTASSS